ncbi:hypothetical protein [Petroclostridium sp. X23]|uniref:hypothetical protein n=1 Tax=Petroclostridium sp. X23 TaxID=3045146 RepID=UPI0024AE4DE0|nr:hypothetical protein [Petroclostridium sp. X23]WHH57280.1 hypothetical protein QKW49_15735 [Petroclostridium sp. X23]
MENYFYKCPICGFIHIVPAYWVSFNPDDEMTFPHINTDTNEECDSILLLMK